MTLTDLIRREQYLNQFSWHLQDYPGYGKLKRELRRELTATAAEVGMPEAIAGLGHPTALAAEYFANLERPYPRWSTAVIWGGAGLYTLVLLAMAYSYGIDTALDALGGGSVQTEILGARTTFTHTPDELSATFQPTWLSLVWLLLATVPLALIGARVWRLWGRTTHAGTGR